MRLTVEIRLNLTYFGGHHKKLLIGGKFEEIRATILRTPKNLAAPTLITIMGRMNCGISLAGRKN